MYTMCGVVFTGDVTVPVVCVVLEGGPNTLKTVKSAIEIGTPVIIIEVGDSYIKLLCFY